MKRVWLCKGREIDLSSPVIMGIVNVTPDSFSDGGKFYDPQRAIEHGFRLLEDGAAILDVGGESTRPGAPEVLTKEELERVIPVIEALADAGAAVSVDTSKAEVMRQAAEAGAIIIRRLRAETGRISAGGGRERLRRLSDAYAGCSEDDAGRALLSESD